MSWTSEFEPPPPRPLLEPEDFNEQGFDLVELDHEPESAADEPSADAGDDGSFPDDGPLDPSVFDGLFDDLDGTEGGADDDDRHPDQEQDPANDSPVDHDTADDDPVDDDTVHDDRAADDGYDAVADADIAAVDIPAEASGIGEAFADEAFADEAFADDGDTQFGEGEEVFDLDSDFEPEVDYPDDLDEDVVESSEDLLSEVIQQNPGLTETLPEHLEPEPFQPDELEQLDAAYLGTEPDLRSQAFDPSPSHFQPEPEVENEAGNGNTTPGQVASGYMNQPGANQVPVEHFRDLPEAAPQPPAVHYDPNTGDHLVASGQLAASGQTVTNGGTITGQQSIGAATYTTGNAPLLAPATKPRRRWPAFAVATVVGASLGVVGALVLFQVLRQTPPETATPAPETPVRTSVDGEAPETTAVVGSEQAIGLASLAATGRFELNTIRFVPGTAELTEASDAILVEAAEAIAAQPDAPLCIEVRTFSEPTAIANRELSGRQGLRVQERLAELGVPLGSVMVDPLGAAPLTEVQPVQTFVVPSSGLEPSALRSATQEVNPFAIGLDPVTNQLRPESIQPLNILGQAMAADEAATLNLAAYSYNGAARNQNEEMASVAAEAAAAYLVTNHSVDRRRITILTLGETPFAVGPALGGHIFVRWGDGAAVNRELEAIDLSRISFGPGSAVMTPETTAALDELVATGSAREVALVIGVHTATESTDAANSELSAIQADALRSYLLAAGVNEDEVRVYGSGNMRQFQGQDVPSGIVITPIS